MPDPISKMPRRDAKAGQSLLFLAAAAVTMLGFLGLVLDGGRLYFEKRRLQAASDAGAMAAAQELRRGNHDSDYLRASAVSDTNLNGYNDDNSTITLANPPSSGSYSTNNLFAEVQINRIVPTTFMRILGANSSTVSARSVAGLLPDSFFCVYALDPSRDGAFNNNGTASFVANCGIMVNSTSSTAFTGSGTNACTTASYIGITGGYDINCSDSRQTEPDTGVPAVTDPLSFLVEPDLATVPSGSRYNTAINGVSTIVYTPGVHNGNVHISGWDNVLFQPGLHVFNNGLTVSGGTMSGTGVTFFNPNPTGVKNIDISGGATVNVSAPTSGPYKGILFWSSRNAPYRPPQNKIARGNAGSTYSGAFYFPNEHFDWGGTPNSAAANDTWQLIVARTVSVQGSANSSFTNPPPDNENPILGPVMVE